MELAKCSTKASVSTGVQECLGVAGLSRYSGDAHENRMKSEAFRILTGQMRAVADSVPGVTFSDQQFSCYLFGHEHSSVVEQMYVAPNGKKFKKKAYSDASTFPNPPPCAAQKACEIFHGHNPIISIPGSEDDNKVVVMGAHWDTVAP